VIVPRRFIAQSGSHLKRVFMKTGTNRQSDLLLLLSRLRPLC
jgi:hypothetical protein